MNAEQLKASIIQQAIEGKLVSQLDSEEPVEQIGTAPGEVPFEIPESWKWLRLDGMATIVRGGSPRPIKSFITEREDGLNWIKIGDAERGTARISHCAEKIIKDGLKKTRLIKKGSLLLTNSMSFGYPYILDVDGCIHDGWLAFSDFESVVSRDYLYYALLSPYCRSIFIAKAAGAVVKNLNIDKVKEVFIPVPPLQEQARIVAKIEELLPLVEAYGKSYDRLQELNAELPGKLKASILQEAIQGKLVPQLDSEEEVQQIGDAPKAVPFTIPEKWKWVKIKSVFTMQAGKFISASSIRTEGKVPCYGGNGLRGYVDEANRNGHFPLIGRQGALCGNVHVVNGEFYATEHAVVVDCGNYGDPECVGLFLKAMNLNQYATATAQPGLSVKKIVELPFPLPPKSEQVRIASKVKELMKQVEALSGLEITS